MCSPSPHNRRLWVPYAYGALYNHPVEALLLDTLGGFLCYLYSGLSCSKLTLFFTLATMKTVLDHCGYRFPVNPIHNLFPNNAAYHDVHHDARFIKKNYSQPFFTHCDYWFGTWMDPRVHHLSRQQLRQGQRPVEGSAPRSKEE